MMMINRKNKPNKFKNQGKTFKNLEKSVEILKKHNKEIVLLDLIDGKSSTAIINKILNL